MKKLKFILLSLILSNIFIGCATTEQSPAYNYEILTEKSNSENETVERQIVFSAYISLTVDNPDTTNMYIKNIAKKYNGYVNETSFYNTVIRVEKNNFDKAIKDISLLGEVLEKDISGEDVTEEYWDYQIRLNNAEKTRKRYLELLAKAQNIEDILKIEKELERLNEKIDLFKGRSNRLKHLTEYSTLNISLEKKIKPGLLGYIGIGLYNTVKWLFVRD